MVDETAENPDGDDDVDPSDLDALLAKITDPEQVYDNTQTSSYVDPGLMGLMEETAYPQWLGMRWREIPVELQQEAWVGLRRWVDWLIAEFKITKSVIPACWFRHSELVAELHAAMNLEWKTWEEGAPTVNPMWMWLPQLQAMMMRLRGFVDELGQCGEGVHREPDEVARDYDDELWQQTVFTRTQTKTLDRPTQDGEATFVRVRVVDDDGEIVGESNLGGAGAKKTSHRDTVAVLTGDGVAGGADAVLTTRLEQIPDSAELVWEKAETQDGPWMGFEDDDDEESAQPPADL